MESFADVQIWRALPQNRGSEPPRKSHGFEEPKKYTQCLINVTGGAVLISHPDQAFGDRVLPLVSQQEGDEEEGDGTTVLVFPDVQRWRIQVDPLRTCAHSVELFRPLPASWTRALAREANSIVTATASTSDGYKSDNGDRDHARKRKPETEAKATAAHCLPGEDRPRTDSEGTGNRPGGQQVSAGSTFAPPEGNNEHNIDLVRSLIPESLLERYSLYFPTATDALEFTTACLHERGENVSDSGGQENNSRSHVSLGSHRRLSRGLDDLIDVVSADLETATLTEALSPLHSPPSRTLSDPKATFASNMADDVAVWLHLMLAGRRSTGKYSGGLQSIVWQTPRSGLNILEKVLVPKCAVMQNFLSQIKQAVLANQASLLHDLLACGVDSAKPTSLGSMLAVDAEILILSRFILCLPLDEDGNAALHIAAEEGCQSVVEFILQHCAATRQHSFAVNRALDHIGWLSRDNNLAALLPSDIEFDFFPCDIHLQEGRGWTALHCAAARSNLRILKRLCLAGADASLTTTEGASTPLHYLAKVDWFAAGPPADLESSSVTDAIASELSREPQSLADLRALPKAQFLRHFFDKFSPTSAQSLPSEVVHLLQLQGNYVDARNGNGETPLQLACLYGHERNVAILLRNGAHVFNTNLRGETALDYARHRIQDRKGKAKLDPIVLLLEGMAAHLQSFVQTFPREVALEIFQYLPAADLSSYTQVCRFFREVAYANILWAKHLKPLLHHANPISATSATNVDADARPAGFFASEFRKLMAQCGQYMAGSRGLDMSLFELRENDHPRLMPPKEQNTFSSVQNHDFFFKFTVVGSQRVGKASFVRRYSDDIFADQKDLRSSNPNVKLRTHLLAPPGGDAHSAKRVKLQVWDNCDARFHQIARGMYRGTQAIFILYDITDQQSWSDVAMWLQEIDRYSCENVTKIVVGCKVDLVGQRAISSTEVFEFCESHALVYCECSAKTGRGIVEAFSLAVEQVLTRVFPDALRPPLVRAKRDKCRLM